MGKPSVTSAPANDLSYSFLDDMATSGRLDKTLHPARNTAIRNSQRAKRAAFGTHFTSPSDTLSSALARLLCAILLVSLASSAVAHDDPSHHNHRHHDHHHHHQHRDRPKSNPPRVFLGIMDASAIAGRLFEYSIPPHAFTGDVRSYRASEAGLGVLPKWLGFKPESGLFFGVPDASDVGQTFVSVSAIGDDFSLIDDAAASFSGSGAKDVFSISVVAKAPRMSASPFPLKNGADAKRECAPEEPSTIASVILDKVYADLILEEKIQLLEKFAEFVSLPLTSVSIFPAPSSRRVFDPSALVAGPGNAKAKRGAEVDPSAKAKRGAGVLLRWQIGCGHDFTQANIELLEKIEKSSLNGTLAKQLERDVIGWQVVNHQSPVEKQQRKKRRIHYNARATATLQPGPIAPTRARPDFYGTATYNPMPPVISSSSSSSVNVKPTRVDPVVPTRRPNPWERTTTTTTTTTTSPRDILRPSSTVATKTDTTTEKLTTATTTTTTTTKKKTTTTLPPTTTTTTTMAKINLGEFTCEEGKFCEHRLPDVHRMFPELGRNDVEVSLLRAGGIGLPFNSWIKYDKMKNLIYGLPLKDHLKPRVMELVVMATDSEGNVFRDAITVKIHHRKGKKKKMNHEFLFKFDMDHDQFKNDVEARIRFLRTLASIFSSSPSDVVITRVKGGSTVVGWMNGTLPYSPCPIDDLTRLKNVVFDDQHKIKNEVIKPMAENQFIIDKASFTPSGPCDKMGQIEQGHPSRSGEVEEFPIESESDVWITTVLPAVIVAIILVLAACIACILYKKSRRGKLSLSDKRTFLNKGIPVIFVDELQENPEPPHTPLILKEEKPPLPPPEYPRSSNGSAPSTPTSEHKEPLSTTEDEHEEGDFPPLHSTASLGRRSEGTGTLSRPNGHPAPFRAPPPYMPPS